ncbi:UDP-N-acetylglucosamine 2-epimerase (non-hydrolyzing) [Candidatus Saccharibacteria bacterium]|nr:UDP-N-acetylglucosamine 2-epimerase (non-hydrolyzing) [Candidatus Saccharibacteria bacterium]
MSVKVLSIFGTRPEAIKMAPVVKELESRPETESVVCVSAQHRTMLDQVLEIFKITPDYDMNIMKPGQTLTYITAEVLKGFEEVIIKEKPDLVLVHGDTTTAMAATLAAFYQQVKVGHVEAGLRTYDMFSPFPEEANRQIIDRIADYLFAPTDVSRQNLLDGKLNKHQKIFVTGNTAIDALKTTVSKDYHNKILDWVGNDRLILLTAHRRENLGEPMRRIFKAIRRITEEFDDVKVIYPVHLNPKVQSVAKEVFGDSDKVRLIDPLDVLDFHNFMERAYIILSDSGGVQEEAPSLGKPVLVLRDTTERPEGIAAGTLKLVGTDTETVYTETKKLLTDKSAYEKMAGAKNPYGDGFASKYIVDAIIAEQGED